MPRILRYLRLSEALTLLLRLYFVRVPVMVWLALALAAPLGYWKFDSFFSGLLYVPHPIAFFFLSLAAFLCAASCLGSFNLIRAGANRRFHLRFPQGGHGWWLAGAHIAPAAFLGMTLAVTARHHAAEAFSAWTCVAVALGAYAAAAGVMLVSRALQVWFTDPKEPDPISLFLGAGGLCWWNQTLKRRCAPGWIVRLFRGAFDLIASAARPLFNEGYADDPDLPTSLAAGHIYAACVAGLSFLTYVGLGLFRQAQIDPDSFTTAPTKSLAGWAGKLPDLVPPALCWVLFFLTMSVWILSGVTYCIDRWRVPLLVLLAAAILVSGTNPETDFYYRVEPMESRPVRPTARALLDERRADGKLILVSAPGGGIQSSAWTTYVVRRLEERTQKQFLRYVGAVSGVSGGSVGLYHLAAAGFDAEIAYQTARQPIIPDVAWGLMVPDIGRIFNPWVRNRLVDRGWALEFASEKAAHKHDLYLNSPEIQPNRTRPALILNATMMERGGPIAFSNSDFFDVSGQPGERPPCGPAAAGSGIQDFTALYNRRIRLVTAARLSASFPYVSPAARAFDKEPLCADYHLLDGGYFDNYGIFSLIRWLVQGLDGGTPQFPEILLVRINAFPENPQFPSTSGWAGQLTHPIDGFLNARETAQGMASTELVQLLTGQLAVPGAGKGVVLKVADLRYKSARPICGSPPLNWILTGAQEQCLTTAWDELDPAELKKITDYVGAK